MRIATWNVNSIGARLPRLLDWLARADPDVVCLQELKCSPAEFPTEQLGALGYQTAVHAAGRWNGVAVLSRVGLDDVRRGLAGEPGFLAEGTLLPAAENRAVAASCAGLRVWSVYVPNGRELGHPHYEYKLRWLAALRVTVVDELPRYPRLAVLGDFNIAPGDDDVWDIAAFADSTHVSAPEREALANLRSAGLSDVRPRALKYDTPYTYWDYRQLCFPKNRGMRIDLVYASAEFAADVADAYVDREARKGANPSDHAPVVVDLR
ncbi:MAG TPA: exodeoxyribonuclease III [Acidothermaceae bacterium]|jgi:exodeoxyribonuclease-3